MTHRKIMFQGNTHVFLYGKNALVPVGELREKEMTYFIGSKKSKLIVRDFRRNPILAKDRSLSGFDGRDFSKFFNSPSYAEISIYAEQRGDETVEAKLFPTIENVNLPTLWLGIYAEQTIPMLDLEWEFLRPVSVEEVAFMIKIPPIHKKIKFEIPLEVQIIR